MPGVNWNPGVGAFNITIGGTNKFQTKAQKALDELYQTASGQTIFNGILAVKNATIVPYHMNRCVCPARNQRSLLSQAWIDDHDTAAFGLQLQAARNTAGLTTAQLAQRINACPRYRIQGVPPVAAGAYGVTAAEITAWESNATPFPGPHAAGNAVGQRDIYNAVCCSLWPHLTAGAGSGSQIQWTSSDGILNIPSLGVNIVKRAAISLGHEFVHAYYNARGLQLNVDDSNSDAGTLYEYMAVGLGPWAAGPSENTIRNEIANVVYDTWLCGAIKCRYGVQPNRAAYG